MFISDSIHTKTAFQAISEYLFFKSTDFIMNQDIPEGLCKKKSCFVTIKDAKNKLRGCIGTIFPVYDNLYYEIIKNAVSSAFYDRRFKQITKSELNTIVITVEVLSPTEQIESIELLNPQLYGAIITDKDNRTGVLLPGIEGINTVEEQIRIIKKKAGIMQKNMEGLKLYRFKTEKHY